MILMSLLFEFKLFLKILDSLIDLTHYVAFNLELICLVKKNRKSKNKDSI